MSDRHVATRAKQRRRWLYTGGGGLVAVVTALALAASAPGAVSAARHAAAAPHVTAQDRAATRAYLEAQLAEYRALLANLPASKASLERFTRGLVGECSGVLASAPRETFGFESEEEGGPPPTARQRGEENRRSRQRNALQLELSLAIERAYEEPDRQARLTATHTVQSLHWSDPGLTALLRAEAAESEWEISGPIPAVCADLRAWADSSYTKLSPQTKALVTETNAHLSAIFARFVHLRRPVLVLLRRSLVPRDRVLLKRLAALRLSFEKSSVQSEGLITALRKAVGLYSPFEEFRPGPRPGSHVIQHGKTATGTHYKLWIEPKKSGARPAHLNCSARAALEETEVTRERHGRVVGGGSTRYGICISTTHPEPLYEYCNEGTYVIQGQTSPAARRARLELSDGRTITSRVAVVPPSLGGPAGYYFQEVSGRGPAPVSLTELNGHGKKVGLLHFHIHRCVRHPNPPVHYPPGGIRTITSGHMGKGLSFAIVGERYRFEGRYYFQLRAHVRTAQEEGFLGAESYGPDAILFYRHPPHRPPPPLEVESDTGCRPHEYALLYGILKQPRDTALVRTPSGLVPLHKVRFPASLHAHGVLAYIALPALPSELIVRNAAGKTVFTQNLSGAAHELRETCEGETEPSS